MLQLLGSACATILLAGVASAAAFSSPVMAGDEFPPTGNHAGQQHPVIQWCDTKEAMASVVDSHSSKGQSAASAVWDEMVGKGVCHWVPMQLATTAILLQELHAVYVTAVDPDRDGEKRQAVIEVWLAAVDGIPDRPVYITRADWAPEEI